MRQRVFRHGPGSRVSVPASSTAIWTPAMLARPVLIGWMAVGVLAGCGSPDSRAEQGPGGLDAIRLPRGFAIDYFHDEVPGARSLARGEGGTVFVGSRGEGVVYALRDADGDGRAEQRWQIAEGLESPNGVALHGGDLFVAEIGRVLRLDDIEARLDDPPDPVVVTDLYPEDRHHGWKFIAFGPDGWLYVPVGAPCNVCEREEEIYSSITRIRPDGSGLEVFAHGVRNTVGFDWHPRTGELWFTDNGRDMLGDDVPPDELNRAPEPGLHFGFPYCHGGDLLDPRFGGGRKCDDFTPPVRQLGPHVAALGMRFYTGSMFPEEYRGQIFIAEHGSWNRSAPIGYRVMLVRLEGNRAVSYEVFADGWLGSDGVSGRPVDVLVMPDGALLVSDDYAGCVYRISRGG
mgnify:CR=1 FL=1